jgi:hypothetical protein
MTALSALLQLLAAASLGVYAGAMLTEALVLVPMWRAQPPADFLAWYAVNGRRLASAFGAVTWAAGLLAVAAALGAGRPGRWAATLAAVLVALAVASFPAYFARANAAFSAGTLSPSQLGPELARWAAWHRGRTAVALGAAGASLLSLVGIG